MKINDKKTLLIYFYFSPILKLFLCYELELYKCFSHLQERIELFGFATRYHGKWGNIDIYDFEGVYNTSNFDVF